jgi:DNA invertase Pin-like site-specific DNA recombinase
MKVAIYVRVSKSDMNTDNQKIQLAEYAERHGWEYDVFEERESSRATRPIKQDLLGRLRKREYPILLIWKLDRWARSLQELIMDIDELTAKGIGFIVLTSPIDTTSAAGRLMIQIMGAFAEFEREMIRERTLAGLERARAEGKKLGRPRKPRRKAGEDLPMQEVGINKTGV